MTPPATVGQHAELTNVCSIVSATFVELYCCREHAQKYHQLVSKCSGNGDTSCILCGVSFKARGILQKAFNCHDCTKVRYEYSKLLQMVFLPYTALIYPHLEDLCKMQMLLYPKELS